MKALCKFHGCTSISHSYIIIFIIISTVGMFLPLNSRCLLLTSSSGLQLSVCPQLQNFRYYNQNLTNMLKSTDTWRDTSEVVIRKICWVSNLYMACRCIGILKYWYIDLKAQVICYVHNKDKFIYCILY